MGRIESLVPRVARLGRASVVVLALTAASACRAPDAPAPRSAHDVVIAPSRAPVAERDAELAAQFAADPVLVARTYIAAPYAEVWRAFTTADGYAPWYSSPCREFPDAPGGACVWGGDERVTYRGTLLRLEPGAGLTHTFRFEGYGFGEPATRVDIELAQAGEVVRVVVRHDCTSAPETWGLITPVGWVKALARLKTLLETGEAMAWPG